MNLRRVLLALSCVATLLPCTAYAAILNIQQTTTPKGIRVWVVEDKTLPVLAIQFAFRGAGSASAPDARGGVTQLLSNTLDEGAADMTSEAFQSALRDHAIDLSFSSSRDDFSGGMRTLLRHKDVALDLLKKSLLSPRFDADPVRRMKDANITRIRSSLSDPDWIAMRLLYDRIYAGHPYARNSGGTLAAMTALDAKSLRAEFARVVGRKSLVVGIAGNITIDAASQMVDDVFGALPEGVPPEKLPENRLSGGDRIVFYAKDMPQTVMAMAWNGIDVRDPDYYAAEVLDYVFGGGSFSSRLMTEVREARGLTYGISSSFLNLDAADRMVVTASMQPQNVAPAMALVKSIATELQNTDIPADTLEAAKDYLTGSLPLSLSSSSRIAAMLVDLQLAYRPASALDDYYARVKAVTAADVRRVAARIFAQEPVVVLVGAKPEAMELEIVTELPDTEGRKK